MHEQLDYHVHAYLEKKNQKGMKVKAAGRPVATTKNKTVGEMRQDFVS
ncbi:hypothetical protein F442_01199, partial [Phytophthora nicotianae P10297]